MPKVLCTRPGASEFISGVTFVPVDGGMLSEDLSIEQASLLFLGCAGYSLVPDPSPEPEKRGPGRPRKEESK